ncbi:hypothetical protein [Methylobacterium sp. WL120]|uniref:hypothetical protein n=1 Tax=Methylobacterium sp. WL120 TaxID=2603887 RepID=UPI001650A498|nr:hypothetical protein [Methylobacterium sp. WL120]
MPITTINGLSSTLGVSIIGMASSPRGEFQNESPFVVGRRLMSFESGFIEPRVSTDRLYFLVILDKLFLWPDFIF